MVTDVDRLRLVYELDDRPAAAGFRRVQQASAQANAKIAADMRKAEGAASGLSKAFGDTNNVRQFGFQVSQVGQQAAATGNLLGAMAIQLPDIAMLFGGAGAAMAGAGAAMAVSLIPMLVEAIGDSETLADRMKALEASTDAMQEAAKLAATPISELSDKYGALADNISRSAAMTAAFTAAQAGIQLRGAAGATTALFPDAKTPARIAGMSDAEWAAVTEGQMRKLQKATGATREQAEELAMALRRLESANGPEAVVRDAENLLSVMSKIPGATEKLAPQFTAIDGLIQQASRQIEAQRSEVVRLREEYGKTTAELQRLVADRSLAEAELAKAVKAGNAEQANAAQGYIDKIDEAIEKTKALAVESDTAFQMIAGRLVNMAESFPDLSLQLPGGAPFAREMATAATEIEAANKGLRELIKLKESGGDYNVTLDNGAYTGGPRDLVNMTINEVLEMQRQMLAHPANKKNSSAAGAYQIVRKTLKGLVDELGLSGNELYDQAMQDRLADQLIRRRRGQGVTGLRNEWEGLKSVSPDVIQRAMGAQSTPLVDPEVQRREEQAASKRQQDLEREVKLRKDKAEAERQAAKALSESLVGQQKAADLERQRADQIAAINAGPGTDAEKASAIAAVNAEMERQITVMALMEEARRRQVDLDAQMVGSTMTYRQAIEALGEAKAQDVLLTQQRAAAEQSAAETQAFWNEQQQTFQDGLVEAIMAGKNFADVLKDMALQMLKAGIQAELMAGLFGQGPLAAQRGTTGGGLLSGFMGLFGGFRADGGPVNAGRAYVVGERGPEIIVPRSAGEVIPNHKLGSGSMTAPFAPNITVAPGVTQADLANAMAAARQEYERNFVPMLKRKFPEYQTRAAV